MYERNLEDLGANTNQESNECALFGSFSYAIQGLLGLLSFMILVIKRQRENPKRPWKVWFLVNILYNIKDVSKQICSGVTVHMLNLLLAFMLAGDKPANECQWYFVNLLIDTFLGIFIYFLFMKLLNKIASDNKIQVLQSGLYFEEIKKNGKNVIRLKLKMYFIQLVVWIIIVVVTKFILLGVTKLFNDIFLIIGRYVLQPFTINEKLELIMVMVVFPVVFNSFQFWFLDNILKLPDDKTREINTLPEDDTSSTASVDTEANKSNLEMDNAKNYVPPELSERNKEETLDGAIKIVTERSTDESKSYDGSCFSEIVIGSIEQKNNIN